MVWIRSYKAYKFVKIIMGMRRGTGIICCTEPDCLGVRCAFQSVVVQEKQKLYKTLGRLRDFAVNRCVSFYPVFVIGSGSRLRFCRQGLVITCIEMTGVMEKRSCEIPDLKVAMGGAAGDIHRAGLCEMEFVVLYPDINCRV